jgi:hypothetical protein
LWYFKVLSLGRFWQVFGSFGQILLHWQWLTACPKITWNLKNLITFEPWVQTLRVVSHWKATNGLYLCFKSQVHQRIIIAAAACPKQQKVILVAHNVYYCSVLTYYCSPLTCYCSVFTCYRLPLTCYDVTAHSSPFTS